MRKFSVLSFGIGIIAACGVFALGWKFLPMAAPASSKAVAPPLTFITNRDNKLGRSKELKQLPGLSKTYDVSAVIYTKELADKLGLSPDYISDALTPGMHSLEIRVKTEGNANQCLFNMLVDNSLPLDFPENPMMGTVTAGTGVIYQTHIIPDLAMNTFKIKKATNVGYYNRNHYYATANYDPAARKAPMMMGQFGVVYIDKDFWPGLAWFSFTTNSCHEPLVRFLQMKGPTIWLKKKGGHDYLFRVQLDKNDFLKFAIPQSLINRILPVIEQAANQPYQE